MPEVHAIQLLAAGAPGTPLNKDSKGFVAYAYSIVRQRIGASRVRIHAWKAFHRLGELEPTGMRGSGQRSLAWSEFSGGSPAHRRRPEGDKAARCAGTPPAGDDFRNHAGVPAVGRLSGSGNVKTRPDSQNSRMTDELIAAGRMFPDRVWPVGTLLRSTVLRGWTTPCAGGGSHAECVGYLASHPAIVAVHLCLTRSEPDAGAI